MPEFLCKLGTAGGSVYQKTFTAESEVMLRRQLEEEGYYLFTLAEKGTRARAVGLLGGRVRRKDLLVFAQELLALVRAGLPIPAALRLLARRRAQPRFRQVLEDLLREVQGGSALSEASARHPTLFPPLYVAALRAGEESGNLAETLSRYIANLKRALALHKKVVSALLYPTVLVILTGAVILFLVTYVVPTFSQIYGDFGAELPAATRLLLGVTANAQAWLPVLGIGTGLGGLVLWQGRRVATIGLALDRLALTIPWVGQVLWRYFLALFCRTLATVLGGGIPMVQALTIAVGAVGNRATSQRLAQAIPMVEAGNSVAKALEGAGVDNPMMVEMIEVGEQTGGLEEMLNHVADFLEEELDVRLSSMATLLEPMIMVSMGLVVAVIVVVMYLPIFHLSSVIR
ncbi:MAG: type II secretion system F family protein [Candidatus Methylomirabilales bacterium]